MTVCSESVRVATLDVTGAGRGAALTERYASSGLLWSLRGGVLPAVLRPVALAIHLQDVDVMGEPVQQRPGEALRSEDLGPFVERQVGGDQDGASLVALAEDLEQQYRPRWWTGARSPVRR